MFEKILVAVDGSDHSNDAIDIACDLAAKYGNADVLLVHAPMVTMPSVTLGASGYAMIPDTETVVAAGQSVIDEAEQRAKAAGCSSVSSKLLRGDPAEAIIAEAAEFDAKLIVAGRRGLGRLRGLLLGSVSQKLTSHAPCAVLTAG